MNDVQQALRDVVAAGPPGYRPDGDPYRRVAARVRGRRQRRVAAILSVAAVTVAGTVLAGTGALAAVAGLFDGSDASVATAPQVVEGRFVLAPVVGETPRKGGEPCTPGTLPEAMVGDGCYRLAPDELGFTARARVVYAPGQDERFSQWVVRIDLPPDAVRSLRDWSDGDTRPIVALVANGTVLHAPLLALPFTGTTWDVGVQGGQRAEAEALLQRMAP